MADAPFSSDTDGDGAPESFNFSRVVSTVVGVLAGAIGINVADVVGSIVAIPVRILETITALAGQLLATLFGAPARLLDAATGEAVSVVSSLGVFGFVAAVGVVVGTAWLVAQARGVAQ